jgi:hypothetical protein
MRLLLTLSMLGVLAACGAPGDDSDGSGTLGSEGRVRFAYQRGCFFGCPIGQPLLAGSQQTVTLTGPGNELGVSAASSDSDVADFALQTQCFCEQGNGGRIEVADDARCRAGEDKLCENRVQVQAHEAGDVVLELRDADGALLDRVELEVREAASAQFSITPPGAPGPVETDAIVLRTGAEGRELLAPVGVHWSVGDPAVATVSAFLISAAAMLDDGLAVGLDAVAPGETLLRVSVPGLEDQASVRVAE